MHTIQVLFNLILFNDFDDNFLVLTVIIKKCRVSHLVAKSVTLLGD